ncbi:hypothetical protein OSB04_un000157 [Centaurea solstitialis]|uniref:Reverse transcriptase domain-containing protein n=1 Tax=Centaurea solstitialis TaxID=347529 RepID=A0AA38S4W0_9ASTR|nr:hypothetical protein OSB04_un000157 [Centaurea solstitialis]
MDAMDQILKDVGDLDDPTPKVVDSQVNKPDRTSVFDRLETDARLKFNEADLNFAKAVGNADSTALSFFPLASKVQSCVAIPKELATEVMKTHRSTLYGYFLGPRLHFPVVERYVRAAWGKYGFCDAMMNNNGIYFFKFNDFGGSSQVVEAGPLMIRGVPLFVEHWDPIKGLTKPIHNSCPLWVKLHDIPLVAFNKEGISRIASALGIPKQMDACTASMCDKAWGRPGFAKVLIETWAVGELKRELQVLIPSLTGGEDVRVKVKVEYLWEPSQCSHCLVFGHKTTTCAKAVAADKKKDKTHVVDDDGFTLVKRKEWRPKIVGSALGTKDGKHDEGKAIPTNDKDNVSVAPTLGDSVMETAQHSVNQVPDDNLVGEQQEGELQVLQPSKSDAPQGRMDKRPMEPSIVKPVTKHFSAPLEVPLKTILKNTNRFSPLAETNTGDVGKDKKRPSTPASKGSVCCWNVRGLNARTKQREVREVIRSKGISICALVETHIRHEVLSATCGSVFGSWKWLSNSNASVGGTRIVLAWDESIGDVMVLDSHAQFLHCFVKLRGMHDGFFLTIVYGANQILDRKVLWSNLRKAKVLMGAKPWTIMGDFNSMLFPHDGYGGSSRRNASMEDFYACVEDIEVIDVPYTGVNYTWVQKPKGGDGLHRKLDRIMANTDLLSKFDGSVASFEPWGVSDHAIGILELRGVVRKRNKGFKFDNFVADNVEFCKIVEHEWHSPVYGSFMHRILTHLKRLKKPLRGLRGRCGDISKRTADLKVELDAVQIACDLDPTNAELMEDLAHIYLAYEKSLMDEDTYLRQRAKVTWLKDGDRNTKFFHNVVKERKGRNFIRSIIGPNGNHVYDEEVGDLFLAHFRGFLGMKDPLVIPEMPSSLFHNKIAFADSLHMIRPISDLEIKKALFQIGNDKAPGSDGYSSRFFKAAWNVVGNDVQIAIHNFFYTGRLTKELNHTLLCFIPKVPNASRVSDFRPISCCTVLYKVISKIISDRMKPYLAGIISPTQSAFIPGRRITDNILMAHELVAGYQRDVGRLRCAFKIDLRKAYDTVDWTFLLNMLKGFGFHPVMCKWIEEMLNTSSFSIALNGESIGFFKGARGLRQGDPISPYLFTLVMEGFSMLLQQCIDQASNFRYHQGCEDMHLTHLCFADDLFVFTSANVESVDVLKTALDMFRVRSGLEPNLAKSEVFFSNVPLEDRQVIHNLLPLATGTFPIRYLGVPLSSTCLRVGDFAPLVTRVKGRIHDWKSKFLSFAGRKQLIISVLQSMQLYWMMVYVVPSAVIHELEGLFRDFLWAQGESSRGKCKLAWESVCKPIACGGLGFKRLATWNRTLITKLIWDLVSKRQTLWVRWIWDNRILTGSFWSIVPKPSWSWIFRKLLGIRPMVRRFFFYQLGNGQHINAWEDNWLAMGPLSSLITYRRFHMMGFNLLSTVRDVLTELNGVWPNDWILANQPAFLNQAPMLADNMDDAIVWRGENNVVADFSVNEAWRSLDGNHLLIPWVKYVWFKYHVPKHAFCMWTACHKRLPTQDRISVWKENPPDLLCPLCNQVPDSHDHLFFSCPFSREVWRRVKNEVDLWGFPEVWSTIMVYLQDNRGPKRMIQKLALSAVVYYLWRERNSRLFRDAKQPSVQIFKLIRRSIMDGMAWKAVVTKLT